MKLSKRRHRLWRYWIRALRKHLNPGVPVEVRTIKMAGHGDSDGVVKLGRLVKIVISVSNTSTWQERKDTLIHEWAHSMEWSAHWFDDSPKKEHGETWGVWYAKAYELITDTLWQDMKDRKLLHRTDIRGE